MAHFAVIAGDLFWIDRTAQAAERRMRWQIARILEDLSLLESRLAGWDYARATFTQSEMLPADMSDAPARVLWKVLQMLDTHRRRLDARPPSLSAAKAAARP